MKLKKLSIEERLDQLEHRVHRYRLMLGGVIAVLCGVLLIGATGTASVPSDLQVRSLRVVSAAGDTLIEAKEFGHKRGGYLRLFGEKGLIELRADEDDTKIGLWNEDSEVAWLKLDRDGGGHLSLKNVRWTGDGWAYGGGVHMGVHMGVHDSGGGHITVDKKYGEDETPGGVSIDANRGIEIMSSGRIKGTETIKERKTVFHAHETFDGDGSLRLGNREGTSILWARGDQNGDGSLEVNSHDYSPLLSVGANSGGKALVQVGRCLTAGADSLGNGWMSLYGRNRHSLFSVRADSAGDGFLGVRSKDGKEFVGLGSAINGNGVVQVWSAEGWPGVSLGVLESGGLLSIRNKTGERIVEAYADEYGHGKIGVWDRKGTGKTLTPR